MYKVNRSMLFVIIVTVSVMGLSWSLPIPDEERYFDKELNRDLMNWLASATAQYGQPFNNPCKYYHGNGMAPAMPKRNSELINSLLSLPKNMNDAGK
uniref:Pigment dispersing factor n=1 Tax=Glossina pallidipes TaxID=7398 RepID=A0A1B0AID3_GLOPL